MPPNHFSLYIDAGRRKRIQLSEPPSVSSGYLYAPNNASQFCLLEERKMLREVNQMLWLQGEEAVVVPKRFLCILNTSEFKKV